MMNRKNEIEKREEDENIRPSPFNKIRKLIHVPHYYVPPCPACGSHVTGHVQKMHDEFETNWLVNEGLKHGEIIDTMPEIPRKNCFCMECGYTWEDYVPLRLISLLDQDREKAVRHTSEMLMQRKQAESETEGKHGKWGVKKFINSFR